VNYFSIIIGWGKAPKFYDGANRTSRSERLYLKLGHSDPASSIGLGLKPWTHVDLKLSASSRLEQASY